MQQLVKSDNRAILLTLEEVYDCGRTPLLHVECRLGIGLLEEG